MNGNIAPEHDFDNCSFCHENGEHEDYKYWAKEKCMACQDMIDELEFNVSFRFDPAQLYEAKLWAKENNFTYRPHEVHNLLVDWMMDTKGGKADRVSYTADDLWQGSNSPEPMPKINKEEIMGKFNRFIEALKMEHDGGKV